MRRDDVAEADFIYPSQDRVGAAGHFDAGLEDTVFQFSTVAQAVLVAVDRQHVGLRGRNGQRTLCCRRHGIVMRNMQIECQDLSRINSKIV